MKKLCLGCHNPIQISSFPPQIFAKKQKNDLARFKKTKELVTFTLAAEVYSIPNMSVLKNNTQEAKNESQGCAADKQTETETGQRAEHYTSRDPKQGVLSTAVY